MDLYNIFKYVRQRDLVEFGIIPELIGRLPVVSTMSNLSDSEMLKILTKPKNALINQFKKLFQMEDVELIFEKSALKKIVELAQKRNSGARSLRAVLEESLMDLMYEVPDMNKPEKIIISEDFVSGILGSSGLKETQKKSA